jgi:hypothetical protein
MAAFGCYVKVASVADIARNARVHIGVTHVVKRIRTCVTIALVRNHKVGKSAIRARKMAEEEKTMWCKIKSFFWSKKTVKIVSAEGSNVILPQTRYDTVFHKKWIIRPTVQELVLSPRMQRKTVFEPFLKLVLIDEQQIAHIIDYNWTLLHEMQDLLSSCQPVHVTLSSVGALTYQVQHGSKTYIQFHSVLALFECCALVVLACGVFGTLRMQRVVFG